MPVDLAAAEEWYLQAHAAGNVMAGHDMAQMLMENAAAAPGRQVDALAWCYWSKSNRPDGSGVSFVGDCDLYSTKLSPDEVTQAQALAAT